MPGGRAEEPGRRDLPSGSAGRCAREARPPQSGGGPGRVGPRTDVCRRSPKRATLPPVSNDTKWIIGTLVLLAGLMSAQFVGVNARIDDLRADMNARFDGVNARFDNVNTRIDGVDARMDRIETRMDRIETRLDGFDERLRNVEIAFAKVDQRLLTLERILLPAPEPPGEQGQ